MAEIILPFSPLSPQEFDRIRHQAEATWQKQTRWLESAMTTYGGSYRTKPLDPSVYNRQYLAEFDQPNYSLESRRAGAQETAKAEGRFPQITSSSQTPFEVKHKVAHQILYGDYHSAHEKEKSHPKMKRSVTYSLVSPCHQGTDVSLRRVERHSPASKKFYNSSDESEPDHFSVYSLKRPFYSSVGSVGSMVSW